MNVRGFKPRRAMVAMCGALMLLAVVPAVASASPEWYVNGAKVVTSKAITETGSVTIKLPYAVGIEMTCHVVKTGTVGSGGSSEITKWTFSACATEGPEREDCTSPELKANEAPWHLSLETVGTQIHDLIPLSAKSEIVVFCKGSRREGCGDVPAENLENHGNNVKARYEAETNKDEDFECVNTRKKTAVLLSSEEIALTEGGTLAVK